MSESTKTAPRVLAVLKLPEYRVPHLLVQARAIVQATRTSPWFPSPSPALATIEAAIDALAVAETATRSRTRGTVEVRDGKRAALVMLLQQLQRHVQATADANPENAVSIIESAGLSVKRARVLPPRVFAALDGPVSGTVKLVAPKIKGATAYEWAYSTDDKNTWIPRPTRPQASTLVPGLTPGATAHFRYRPVMRTGPGDWSDPVSVIVI